MDISVPIQIINTSLDYLSLPCCMSYSAESWWRSMYLSSSQHLSVSSSSGVRDGTTSVGLYVNWALSVKYRRASNLKSHIPFVSMYTNMHGMSAVDLVQKQLSNGSNNNNFQFLFTDEMFLKTLLLVSSLRGIINFNTMFTTSGTCTYLSNKLNIYFGKLNYSRALFFPSWLTQVTYRVQFLTSANNAPKFSAAVGNIKCVY